MEMGWALTLSVYLEFVFSILYLSYLQVGVYAKYQSEVCYS